MRQDPGCQPDKGRGAPRQPGNPELGKRDASSALPHTHRLSGGTLTAPFPLTPSADGNKPALMSGSACGRLAWNHS